MARNEKTSARVATIAARVLGGAKPTAKEIKMLAASVLTQVEDRGGRKG